MNGMVIGKRNTSIKGVWTPSDVTNDTNNIAKRPVSMNLCKTAKGWFQTISGISVSINTTTFLTGGCSVNFVKTATSFKSSYYFYKFCNFDLTGKRVGLNVFTSAGRAASVTKLGILLHYTNTIGGKIWELYKDITTGFVSGGWANFEYALADFTQGAGATPDPTCVNLIGLHYEVSSNSVTMGAGDLVVDDFYYRRA